MFYSISGAAYVKPGRGKVPKTMSAIRKIARSAGVVGVSTLASRVLGLVRDMVMSAFFGAGPVADAIYIAFMLPNLFRRLVGEGAPVASFITVFTKLKQEEGEEAGIRFAETFWTLMTIILASMTLAGMLGARPIVWAFTNPEFRAVTDKYELTVTLTRQMFPYLFFISLVALAMGILNSYKKFFAPAISPALLNICYIGAVVLLGRFYGGSATPVVIGVLLGGVAQLAVQLPWLWQVGLRFRPRFNFSHPGIKKIGLLVLPSTFAVGVSQINALISNFFITAFEGGRSQFYYSNRLTEFPFAIISLALATAILPTLSEQAGPADREKFRGTFISGLRLTAFLMIPATLGLMLIGHPLIEIIYQRGKFTAADTDLTYWMLAAFCLELPAIAGHRLVVQAYYALEDMRTPVLTAVASLVVNLVGAWLFTQWLGRTGVPLALAMASIVNLAILSILLPKKFGERFDVGGLWGVTLKSLLAAAVMVAPILAVDRLLYPVGGPISLRVAVLALEIAAAVAVFIGAAKLMKIPELDEIFTIVFGKLRRKLGR